MHSKCVCYRLLGVITGRIGGRHAELGVAECFAVINQRLCQRPALGAWDFLTGEFLVCFQTFTHGVDKLAASQKYLPLELLPYAGAANTLLHELDVSLDLALARALIAKLA